VVFVKADLDTIRFEEGFTLDVRKIGHYGAGDLEITVSSDAEMERAKPLITVVMRKIRMVFNWMLIFFLKKVGKDCRTEP
jgi:predicted transport protein